MKPARHLFLEIIVFISLFQMFILHSDSSLTFKYAFLHQTPGSPTPQSIDYTTILTKLSPGDKLKIFLKPIQNAYIYLYLQDTSGALYLLFPTTLNDFDSHYKLNKNYYIPKGDDWFHLDDAAGTEKFHLLVSAKRLEKLEELTTNYLEHLYSNTTPEAELPEARQKVMEEIKTIRLAHSRQETKEDPVLVACDFRGMSSQFEFNALEVETEGFYSKTIRIEHQEKKHEHTETKEIE